MRTATDTAEDLAAALITQSGRLIRLISASASTGISATGARTLARLDESGPARVTDLAAAEHVAQPTMTALVDRMERAGYVRREHDPVDGRAVLVSITTAGRRQRAHVRQVLAEALAPRLLRLSETERDQLERYARILVTLMEDTDN